MAQGGPLKGSLTHAGAISAIKMGPELGYELTQI